MDDGAVSACLCETVAMGSHFVKQAAYREESRTHFKRLDASNGSFYYGNQTIEKGQTLDLQDGVDQCLTLNNTVFTAVYYLFRYGRATAFNAVSYRDCYVQLCDDGQYVYSDSRCQRRY